MIWTKAISEKSIQTMKEAMKGFENVALPTISGSLEVWVVEILGLCECSTCLSVSFYLINL